ncbi:hypothetical protein [Lentzea nigeriaca]|uniref:hypothetical protein n=1 Tax=Lentzea nigeriaca TaxID=1128665 RepID=UPI00195AD790|nr:hypothetical protein [Lentzea nigeriaca]MBM7860414.1 cytochrome c oxidase assembly factor CtaG [Lentzea nigeriaca]
MNAVDTRRMLAIIAPLLILAGIVVLNIESVPPAFGWPFALMFFAIGIGLGAGVIVSKARETSEQIHHDQAK